MEFSITEEQRLLRQTVQEFVAKEIAPHVEAWEEKGDVPDSVFHKLGAIGLLGAPIPAEYGGAGLDAVTYAMLTEELAKGCSSLRTTISVNTSLFGMNVLLFGSEAQKKRYLPAISSGEKRGAWALTEPQSGSDAAGLRTTAVKKGDAYVLNGHKMWISDGGKADYHVVYARTNEWDPKKKRDGLCTFVVHKDDPGFRVGSVESKGRLPAAARVVKRPVHQMSSSGSDFGFGLAFGFALLFGAGGGTCSGSGSGSGRGAALAGPTRRGTRKDWWQRLHAAPSAFRAARLAS